MRYINLHLTLTFDIVLDLWVGPQPIAAVPSVLCCHLANTNEEFGGLAAAILLFATLLWLSF